ncbi:class 1 fructose-bisphosphatase [Helicobacter sp. 11S02596-1]|uniref:class 1 fructose-bisphosphatase n=1 Tax=Helicobacter sp. 11S02596-1 TaxID=1476194 RepID=UPI000BA783DE|nr:class 1 fructose-bisphosphatase [Helicobacter sp. 11S02596-1]PAF44784.1 fructose-bisphosphatase [Helicobacter sp. 11S02596-1]
MPKDFIPTLQKCALQIQELIKTTQASYLETTNTSGDTQLGIDVQADNIIENALLGLECVRGICSEEKPEAIFKDSGSYLVAYDPLDGSSIIDSNLSVGSIFGIYQKEFQAKYLVGSAYIIYGPRLEMVLASTASDSLEYFIHGKNGWEEKTPPTLKAQGKINAPGGTQKYWKPEHKNLIESLFMAGYRLRYSGGMVPDLHQILIKGGGLFSYPGTTESPNGKLRKLFEVFPFALIYEKAGGEAIDGKTRLLELPIDNLHESTPCFFGSKTEIEQVRKTYANQNL